MSEGISFGLLDSMSLVLWAVYEGIFAGWIADIESNVRHSGIISFALTNKNKV